MDNLKMRNLCIWMVLIVLPSLCFSQKADVLNFQFKASDDFRWSISYSSLRIGCSSTEIINGKGALVVCKPPTAVLREPLRGILEQKILLSGNLSGTLQLSIHNKTKNLQKAKVFVRMYDAQERILKEDSLNILSEEVWKWKKLTCSVTPFRFIRISIEAVGTNILDDEQNLYLDRMTLLVNGKNINQISFFQEPAVTSPLLLNNKMACPLNDSIQLPVTPFHDKKIIGLGETMHLNGAIQKVVCNIFKEQIKSNNCRLILLELPVDYSLVLNWYVSGKAPDYFIEVIRRDLSIAYGDDFVGFIRWLRTYNKNNPLQLVRLLCVDICSFAHKSHGVTYFDSRVFSKVLFATIKPDSVPSLVEFTRSVITNKYKEAQAKMLIMRDELTEILGEDNFEILQEILKQMQEVIPAECMGDYFTAFYLATHRDYRMFLNYEKFSSMFLKSDEQVILYAHIGHLAKSQTCVNNVSLGAYLSKKYPSAYYPIGIIAGTGTSTMYHDSLMVNSGDSLRWTPCYNYKLQDPIPNSLEESAMKIQYDKYFYPLDTLNCKISGLGTMKIILNNIGRTRISTKQFSPVYYKGWMDGFIFIREGEPLYDLQKINFANDYLVNITSGH